MRRALWAIVAVWLLTLLVIRLAVTLVQQAGAPSVLLVVVPILFAWVPVWDCWRRGVDEGSYPLTLPPLAVWKRGLVVAGLTCLAVLPPWAVGYHYWQSLAFGLHPIPGRWPEWVLFLALYHFAVVAIPEEIFYRGYLQARLDEVFGTPWRVGGAAVGHGWWVASLLFAFGHSVVVWQWWHFAIFFPGLVFGWMRAKTSDIAAGSIFHAVCNVTVSILDVHYGLIPPN